MNKVLTKFSIILVFLIAFCMGQQVYASHDYGLSKGKRDPEGNTFVIQDVNQRAIANGTDGYAVSSACTIRQVIVTGKTAGDHALIYDGNSTTGTLILDAKVDTNNKIVSIPIPNGLPVTYDVYVDVTDTDVHCVVLYDT